MRTGDAESETMHHPQRAPARSGMGLPHEHRRSAQSPRNLLRGGSGDFASYYASKKKSYDNGLKVLIKAYEKKH